MNIIVAVPIDEKLASFIGKKGSNNSITFYNRKSGNDVIVALFPSQEDEKVYALAESLLVSSQVVISTATLDKKFGEALIAASLLKKKMLLSDDNDVSQMLSGAGAVDFTVVAKNGLLEAISANAKSSTDSEPVRIDVDKAFPVKGIGTVVLGVVTRGTLRQHDKLVHTSGKEVLVRSIQSQDEDVRAATAGTRVGVSLKDIGDEEIRKGDLLAAKHVARCSFVRIAYKTSKAAKESIAGGKTYGLALNFSYCECVVKDADAESLGLELRSPFPAELGDEVLLLRKEMPRIFASGRVIEARAQGR